MRQDRMRYESLRGTAKTLQFSPEASRHSDWSSQPDLGGLCQKNTLERAPRELPEQHSLDDLSRVCETQVSSLRLDRSH